MSEFDTTTVADYYNGIASIPAVTGGVATIHHQDKSLLPILKALYEEYVDRKAQFGSDYLWEKHECQDVIERARRAIQELEQEAT